MGVAQFDSTCKRGLPFDAKIKVDSLQMMESINRSYLINTSKSPQKIQPHASLSSPKQKEYDSTFDIRKAMANEAMMRKDSTITEVESTGSCKGTMEQPDELALSKKQTSYVP